MFPWELQFWRVLHYNNILILALELFLYGGWVFVFWKIWPDIKDEWLNYRQGIFWKENPDVTMEISVSYEHEREIEAIQQIFSQVHGLHRNETWWERWWKGQYTLKIALEIVSFEGHIRYFIRSTHKHKHLVQHAIYAQYPKVHLRELKPEEDFIHLFPSRVPHPEFDILGTEYVLAKPDYFPLKTYKHYITEEGKFLDPLRHLLEFMSHLKEGEYAWYQIIIVPQSETWALGARHEVESLLREKPPKKKTQSIIIMFFESFIGLVRAIITAPINLIRELYRQLFVGTGKILKSQVADHTYKEAGRQIKGMGKEALHQIACLHEAFLGQFREKKPKPAKAGDQPQPIINIENKVNPEVNVDVDVPGLKFPSDYLFLTKNKKRVIDSIEEKLSQQMFRACVRAIYIAKKPVFAKFRFWAEFHGCLRHFNDIEYNMWTRGTYTKTSADYFFSNLRKKIRKNKILVNAKGRAWYAGDKWIYLSAEEIASLWHFPVREDLLANLHVTKQPFTPPPSHERINPGYKKERLLEFDKGTTPADLPVGEFEPYNYP